MDRDDPGRASWPAEDPPPNLFRSLPGGELGMRFASPRQSGRAGVATCERIFRAVDGFVYERQVNGGYLPVRAGFYPTGPLLRVQGSLAATLQATLHSPAPQRTGLTANERRMLGL